MSTVLNKIAAYKREEVAQAEALLPLASVRKHAEVMSPTRDFTDALRAKQRDGNYGLIAEIKKASPSRGVIRADFDPPELAKAYAAGGAACLSILTDAPSFQGSLSYLEAAREAVTLPLLRKDFILSPYQVYQSRSHGADAILLIMAMIDDALASDLEALADHLKLSVLIEVHNESELERALKLRSPLIGINNRDLHSFETSLDVTKRLAPLVPKDRLVISESGLFTADDLSTMRDVGITTFLIGESLMRQHDVATATREILRQI